MPHLPDHQADHDPLLLAAYAAGDAEGEDLARARDLVATCDECAALHHDLRAIAAALPAVPAPARTRDFRLSPEQAASLRPAGWRRLLAPLAGPRFAFAAPLGGSLAALGLAGVLVAGAFSAPLAGTGGGESAPNQRTSVDLASGAPAAAPVPAAGSPAASSVDAYLSAPAASAAAGIAPGAGIVEDDGAGAASSGPGEIAGTGPAATEAAPVANGAGTSSTKQEQPSGVDVAGPIDASTAGSAGVPPVVPIVSAALLLVGLVLLGLALVGRRVGRATG